MTPEQSRVLILGAGLVCRPIVRFFLDDDSCRLTVASLAVEDAEELVENHPRGTPRAVDVSDPAQLEPLVEASDLVISLVPYVHHPAVARCAIRHRVDVVTASYLQPEIRALDAAAREAGITILNEVGLDPGLDHMSAMRMIDRVHAEGGRVSEFRSCCGGLPSPEAADNPWKYKFSWSPRGALLAARLAARYLDRGRVIDIPGEALFEHHWPYEIEGVGRFEIYPNRNSLCYVETYGLHDVETMLRATIRYPGWSATMKAVTDLGLLDVTPRDWGQRATYSDFLAAFLPDGTGPLAQRLARRLGRSTDDPILERFAWVGLLAGDPLPEAHASPLDILAHRFSERMAYADGERDMVLLRHDMCVRRPDRDDERRISLLVAFGEPDGDSATARTVSLPTALAGRLLLDGRIEPGVRLPTVRQIYEPILTRLEDMGIVFREWTEPATRN